LLNRTPRASTVIFIDGFIDAQTCNWAHHISALKGHDLKLPETD